VGGHWKGHSERERHCSDGKRVKERGGERPTENESDKGKAGDVQYTGAGLL